MIIFGIDPAGAGEAAPQVGKRLADLGRNFRPVNKRGIVSHSRCLGTALKARTISKLEPATNHRYPDSYRSCVTLRSIARLTPVKPWELGLALPAFQRRCSAIVPRNASTVGMMLPTMMSTPSAVG